MNENLDCSSEFERRLWDIRDLLYRAVQDDIAAKTEDARVATKEAYEKLSGLLDRLGSNLKNPERRPQKVVSDFSQL